MNTHIYFFLHTRKRNVVEPGVKPTSSGLKCPVRLSETTSSFL